MKLLLGGSFFFSILHSILLWEKQPGIATVIFCITLLAFFIYILAENKKITNKKELVLCVPIVLLSLTYFIFNNPFFQIMNLFVICALWFILIINITQKENESHKLMGKIFSLIMGPFECFQYIGEELKKLCCKKENSSQRAKLIKRVLKALVITVPIVCIVVFLLTTADSIFANLFSGISKTLENLFDSDELPYFIARIFSIIFIFFYMASFLYNIIMKNTMCDKEKQTVKKETKIDAITIQTIVTILNIIYLIFSIIQIMYLFTKTQMPSNFNYAEYARQGFFQLMFVSLLNFILLYIVHSNLKETTKFQKKYIVIMELTMEIFTLIIIASAFYRMYLYEQAYGYTYLRLFVYFILVTEFLFMLPTMWYTIGKKVNLWKTGLSITVIMYLILNYSNVDALIARNNINRYYENQQEDIDFYYLKCCTGTDAIPEIQRLLNTDDVPLKQQVIRYLKTEKQKLEEKETWQEYNLSKQKARNCLKEI